MLEEKIHKSYLDALKSKDRHKADFLSFVRSGLKNHAIELKKEKLDDSEVLEVLKKQQKRLQDSKESIEKSGREELLKEINREISILCDYLPKPLDETELSGIIEEVISSTNASSIKDMGKVMKETLARVGLQADSKTVSILVKNRLSSI